MDLLKHIIFKNPLKIDNAYYSLNYYNLLFRKIAAPSMEILNFLQSGFKVAGSIRLLPVT